MAWPSNPPVSTAHDIENGCPCLLGYDNLTRIIYTFNVVSVYIVEPTYVAEDATAQDVTRG